MRIYTLNLGIIMIFLLASRYEYVPNGALCNDSYMSYSINLNGSMLPTRNSFETVSRGRGLLYMYIDNKTQ